MPDTPPPPPNRPDLRDNSQKAKDISEIKKLQDRLDQLSEELDKKLSTVPLERQLKLNNTIDPQKSRDTRGNPPFIRQEPRGAGGGAGNKGKGTGKGEGEGGEGSSEGPGGDGPPTKKPDPSGDPDVVPESTPSEVPELPPAEVPAQRPAIKEKEPGMVPGSDDNKLKPSTRPTPTPQPSATPDDTKTKPIINFKQGTNIYFLCDSEIPCLWLDDGICPMPNCPVLYDWNRKGLPDPNSPEARSGYLCPCGDSSPEQVEPSSVPVKETQSEGEEQKPTPSSSGTESGSKPGEVTPTEIAPIPVPQKPTGETSPTKTSPQETDAPGEAEPKKRSGGGGGNEEGDGEGEGEGRGGSGWRLGVKRFDVPFTGFGPGGPGLPFYIPWIYGPDDMDKFPRGEHGIGPDDIEAKRKKQEKEKEELEKLRKEREERIKQEEEARLKLQEKFNGIDIPTIQQGMKDIPFGEEGIEASYKFTDNEGETISIDQKSGRTVIEFPTGEGLFGGNMTTEEILKEIENYNKKYKGKTVPIRPGEKINIGIDPILTDPIDSKNIDPSEKSSASLNQGLDILSGDLFDALKSQPLAASTLASTTNQGSNTNINVLGGQSSGSMQNSGFSEFINTISNPDTTAQRIMESLEKARVFI